MIAEKTGYPAEMLELDMALDADLGIDSIKRVEILSALQERLPEAPQVKPEHLGTLHSLRHIAAFLAGGDAPATAAADGRSGGVAGGKDRLARRPGEDHARRLLEVIAEKTGYPAEMLELDMALDADLGIDSIKRVEILSALAGAAARGAAGQARAPRHAPQPPPHRRLPRRRRTAQRRAGGVSPLMTSHVANGIHPSGG